MSLAYIYCKYQHIVFISFFCCCFCLLLFYAWGSSCFLLCAWLAFSLFRYLALCSYWLLFRMQITECHGNERALKKKGKIMLSSNCLLFVRKCVKYMTWKYFQNGLWLPFWCIFLLLSKGVGIFPIGKYDKFINTC